MPRTVFNDIPRLLRGRGAFRELSSEAGASVPAFLAWKALLVAAHNEAPGADEPERCRRALESAHAHAPEVIGTSVTNFHRALERFKNAPCHVLSEWFLTYEVRTRSRVKELESE